MDSFLRSFVVGWVALFALLAGAQPTPDKWEKEISGLESRLRANPPGPGAVVLFGSSSFRLWKDAETAFPGHRVVNLGFGGCQTSDLNQYFDRLVKPLQPRLILVYGGDNDLASGKTPAQVEADFRQLVAKVRSSLPRTRVGFVAIKPSPSREKLLAPQREANQRIRRFAARHRRVDFLDVARPLLDGAGRPDPGFFVEDRLHLNARGYEAWVRVLAPYVNRWDR